MKPRAEGTVGNPPQRLVDQGAVEDRTNEICGTGQPEVAHENIVWSVYTLSEVDVEGQITRAKDPNK
ncbi:MAG TPA: hypothetical protein VKB50_30685 [Vicinamibacterales bacterium]|nr:hypothetical protein [Vicinamibacterales bacterium]